MKEVIQEVQSINDDVLTLSSDTLRLIWQDATRNNNLSLSRTVYKPFKRGSIDMQLNGRMRDVFHTEVLHINYILYVLRNEEEFAQVKRLSDISVNSTSNFQERSITVVGAVINGVLDDSFSEDVIHEIEHLLEYACGIGKNEALYDKAVYMSQNAINDAEALVGTIMYLTFKHEQDAYTHQYFAQLRKYGLKAQFSDTLKGTWYEMLEKYWEALCSQDKDEAKNAIKKIGFTYSNFKKRAHYAKKRLWHKLRNAFIRFRSEHAFLQEVMGFSSRIDENILNKYKEEYPNIEYEWEDDIQEAQFEEVKE